jgi:GntR family transcriptional regulator
MVVSGMLMPGDRLPSIRELARELHVNPTTVSRIYSELAHRDVITLRQGQGAFVTDRRVRLAPEEVRALVGHRARELLSEGMRLGLGLEQILQLVREEHACIEKGILFSGEGRHEH